MISGIKNLNVDNDDDDDDDDDPQTCIGMNLNMYWDLSMCWGGPGPSGVIWESSKGKPGNVRGSSGVI
eukprot:1107598-Karenia_brevis.AAC.1